jgi:hypothetical protein
MAGVVIAVGAAGWPLAGCSPAGWSSPLSAHAGSEPTDNIAQAMAAPEIILFFMGRPFFSRIFRIASNDPEEAFNGTLIDHEVGKVEDAQRIFTASASTDWRP